MNAWRTDSAPRRRPSFRDCHGACVVGKMEAVPVVDVSFSFVPSQTREGKGNTTVTGENQPQVIWSYFVLVALDLWRRGSGKLGLDLALCWHRGQSVPGCLTEHRKRSSLQERPQAHPDARQDIQCKCVWTDRSAGRGVLFFRFANIVMFWNASLRTVTHFRRCSQTSLLCTRRHANRSLTAERLRGAEFIGAWKRAVAHDVEVTTHAERYGYGSVLGNGWLRGWVGSEVRNVLCKPESTRHCCCFLHCHFFLQTDFQKKALSFS